MTLSEQGAVILKAMSEGSICQDDAKSLFSAIASQARIAEYTELEERITQLEEFNEKS